MHSPSHVLPQLQSYQPVKISQENCVLQFFSIGPTHKIYFATTFCLPSLIVSVFHSKLHKN